MKLPLLSQPAKNKIAVVSLLKKSTGLAASMVVLVVANDVTNSSKGFCKRVEVKFLMAILLPALVLLFT